MFGQPDANGARPAFAAVEERVAWWAEVFESPCVGYAASPGEIAALVAAGADFVALGDWLWSEPGAVPTVLAEAARHLRLPEIIT
jgi:thiamine-phosphate pyrophosphorylase